MRQSSSSLVVDSVVVVVFVRIIAYLLLDIGVVIVLTDKIQKYTVAPCTVSTLWERDYYDPLTRDNFLEASGIDDKTKLNVEYMDINRKTAILVDDKTGKWSFIVDKSHWKGENKVIVIRYEKR